MLRVHLDRESSSRAAVVGLALDHLQGWRSTSTPGDADLSVLAGALEDREVAAKATAGASRILVLAPLAADLRSAQSMCRSLADTPTLYGEAVLHSPLMVRATELVDLMDSITYVEATALRMLPTEDIDDVTAPFVELASDRGDVLLDQGSQAVAAVLSILGGRQVDTVACAAEPGGATARLTIEIEGGAIARVLVGWDPTAVWDLQVAGPTDVVRLELAPNTGLECQGQPVHVAERPVEPQQLETMGFLTEVEHALSPDATTDPAWPIDFGLRVMEVIDAARRSLDAGGAPTVIGRASEL